MSSWLGCIHSSQSDALDDRRRLAAVVGVRVGADEQRDVLAGAACTSSSARSRLRHRARLVHAGVEQHEPVAGGDRPRVAVGNARPGQRQAQADRRPEAPARPGRARACVCASGHAAETRLRPFERRKGGVRWPSGRSASEASTKVQEVAANVAAGGGAAASASRAARPRASRARYFAAIDARDLDAAVALWARGGREHVRGQVDVIAPDGVREFIGELLRRRPRPAHARSSRRPPRASAAACSGACSGTFAGPGALGGIAPTGSPIDARRLRPDHRARRPDPAATTPSPTR